MFVPNFECSLSVLIAHFCTDPLAFNNYCVQRVRTLSAPVTQPPTGRALGIYRILIKITQKQWIKDEYILNIGSVLILFVLLTVYRLDLF